MFLLKQNESTYIFGQGLGLIGIPITGACVGLATSGVLASFEIINDCKLESISKTLLTGTFLGLFYVKPTHYLLHFI